MHTSIPGEDHLINFQKGDPYTKIDEGYARLPGAGYEALHAELEGINPEDYPDLTKLRILADVAPYSREYNRIRAIVEKQSHGDSELRADCEQIVEQVRQTKDSTLQVDQRRFDAPVDRIDGTVRKASFHGVERPECAVRPGAFPVGTYIRPAHARRLPPPPQSPAFQSALELPGFPSALSPAMPLSVPAPASLSIWLRRLLARPIPSPARAPPRSAQLPHQLPATRSSVQTRPVTHA